MPTLDPIACANTWIEVSRGAIANNVSVFRRLAGADRALMVVVKGNAYGHGMVEVATVALDAGADWLGVFDVREGIALRAAGVEAPILVMGPVPEAAVDAAIDADLRLSIASGRAAATVCEIARGRAVTVHLKLETGTNRQGLAAPEIEPAAAALAEAGIRVEGAFTHFADIEDTTDHTFARGQLERFEELLTALRAAGHEVPVPHTACTAAAILFPSTYFACVRVGIGLYGLWPSKETQVSAGIMDRNGLGLVPAMTWKTRIAQVKVVPAGGYVGYGRTYRTTHESRIGVLPLGYADGYDRGLSSNAHALVRGMRAGVVGRVCMNMTMVDVTDIPGAVAGDEVILLGRQGDEAIRAEDLARFAGTINYEIVTRAAPGAPRLLVK